MESFDVWKELLVGVVVGAILMYQQRRLKQLDDLESRLIELDKHAVKWAEHDRDIERIEERHSKSLEKVIDKLDAMQGEMAANITNLYKLLVEKDTRQ